MSNGPLSDLLVLDVGTMVAGPVAATLLGDWGADVVKVERPDGGDTMREIGPFANGESLYWNVENRNKKSVTIDLRVQSGQELFRKLAARADVVVENFRPGTMKKWGVDYNALHAINPKLVMLSISAYGQTGPNAHRAGMDRIAQAYGGLLHITGFPDRAPVRPGTAIADYQAALFGAFAVLTALYVRDARGGEGQHIDVSLFESIFRFTDILVTAYDKLGIKRERRGNLHFAAAPGDHFLTDDGRYLVLTVSGNVVFERLCRAMGKPQLMDDERFSTHEARWANIETINSLVGDWIASMPVAEVMRILDEGGLSYSLVLTAEDILADAHYAARGSISTVENARTGPLKMQSAQPRFSGLAPAALRAAPQLGEHNEAIFQGMLGLPSATLDEFRRLGAI